MLFYVRAEAFVWPLPAFAVIFLPAFLPEDFACLEAVYTNVR